MKLSEEMNSLIKEVEKLRDDSIPIMAVINWAEGVSALEAQVADQKITIMACEDAISEVWEERVRDLEAELALEDRNIPTLGARISQLEAKVAKLWEAIRHQQETSDARQCPCRLHFKHALPELFDE